MPRLLVLSSVRWDFLWQRHQALSTAAAARGWTVDFVEPPLRGLPHLASALRGRAAGRGHAVTNPRGPGVGVVRLPLAFSLLPSTVQRRLLSRRCPGRYDACLLYLPTMAFVSFAERVAERAVYDEVVDWSNAPRTWFAPTDADAAEERMASAGWAHLTDSENVATKHRARGVPTTVVPPACDEAFLHHAWQPARAGSPVAYFGTVRSSEIDIDLLCTLATAGVPVRTIGPVDEPEAERRLRGAGVDVQPVVGPAELPALIDDCAALLLPYAGRRAETLVPAKLWNCLATDRQILCRGLALPSEARAAIDQLPAGDDDAVSAVRQVVAAPQSRAPVLASWQERWESIERSVLGGAEPTPRPAME